MRYIYGFISRHCLPDIRKLSATPSDNIGFLIRFVSAGLIVAIFYHTLLNLFGVGFPWNTFLFDPADRFHDWYNSVNQAASSNPYYFSGPALATYFPAAYVLFKIGFGLNGIAGTTIYLSVTVALFACAFFLIRPAGIWKGTNAVRPADKLLLALACALSYPVLFSLDRGNIDIWIALLCVIFVTTQSSRRSIIGLLALSIAISMKGYPAALLLLLVSERKYLHILTCAVLVLLFTALPTFFMWGGFDVNVNGLLINLRKFYDIYVIGPASLFASSDPYNFLRLTLYGIVKGIKGADGVSREAISRMVLSVYQYASLAFAFATSVYVMFVAQKRWRKVTAISLLMILFPNVANDYKLCALLPALYILTFEDLGQEPQRSIFLLICLLLIPKSYLFIDGKPISMAINPMILTTMAYLILKDTESWMHAISRVRSKSIRVAGY